MIRASLRGISCDILLSANRRLFGAVNFGDSDTTLFRVQHLRQLFPGGV